MKLNDKGNLEALRRKVGPALAALEAELGVKFRLGNCRYSPNGDSCKFQLEVADEAAGDPLEVKFRDEFYFLAKCRLLAGLTEDHLGKEVTLFRKKYVVVGAKPRAKKQNLILRRLDNGSLYRFEPSVVAAGLRVVDDTEPVVTTLQFGKEKH